MNCVKKVIMAALVISVLALPVFAGLLEDVDKLTPEEAVKLQEKLQQKRFEATPENSRMIGFVQLIEPTPFNNTFPGLPDIRNAYGGSFELRKPLNDRLLVGGSFGGAGNFVYSESSTKVYEDLWLAHGYAQLVMEYRIVQNKSFILSLTPGAGVMLGFYNYTKTDDNAKTYYNTNRWGTGFCTSFAVDATWKIYKEWGLGIGISSFSGKLSNMHKMLSSVDYSAADIDLTGTTFRISGSKDF